MERERDVHVDVQLHIFNAHTEYDALFGSKLLHSAPKLKQTRFLASPMGL